MVRRYRWISFLLASWLLFLYPGLSLKQTFWNLLQHAKIKVIVAGCSYSAILRSKHVGVFSFEQQDLRFFVPLIAVTISAPAPGYRAGTVQPALSFSTKDGCDSVCDRAGTWNIPCCSWDFDRGVG